MWKGVAERVSKEEIKKQLLGSMIIDEVAEKQRSRRSTRS